MKPSRSFFSFDTGLGLALAVCAFGVYLLTCSAHVGTEDPGEIATALHGMGILHPTGYPLYTMIGALFARLPLGESVIETLNVFGAVLTALATFLFYGTFRTLLTGPGAIVFGRHDGSSLIPSTTSATSDHTTRIGAAVATVVFAFSAVYWSEAVWLEVYALHLVFLALVIRLFVQALAAPQENRRWLLFAYVLGLSFAHHMMTVLLAPAFLLLFFQVHGFGRAAWVRIARAVPPFILALTAYLYLPIRSAADPLMNWGEPKTFAAVWKHVTAAQYGNQMFSSLDVARLKLTQFIVDLPGDFGYAPLALAALGFWPLFRAPRLLAFTILIFATGLFYAVNYSFDDPNFYLNPHFALSVVAGVAAAWLLSVSRGWGRVSISVLIAGIALCPLVFNYPKLDKSRDSLVDDYARNVLMSTDVNAVLFSNEYERFASPAFYLQNVEGFRADVTVIDVISLGSPWYLRYLAKRDPGLIEAVRPELEAFRTEMDRFLKAPGDSAIVRVKVAAMFQAMVERSMAAGRPVYVTEGGANPTMIERYQHAPTGMVFRLLEQGDSTRVPLREPQARPLPKWNKLTPLVQSDYAESYAYQGAYLAQWGDTTNAIRYLRRAMDLLPGFPDVAEYLKELERSQAR